MDGAARATRDRSSCARRGNDLRRLRHRVPGHAHHGHMRAAGSACLGANSPDNMVTDAGTEGDRRGRGGAVSTPCRLSPKDAAATLLTALLTVRGRTSKKAVEDWLGTGSAAVREGAAPGDSSSLSRVQDIGRRRRGAKQPVAPHAGRYHYLAVRTVVLPVRRETQQATERLGGVMNQLPAPSASTAGGASGCFSARLACRGPVLESLSAGRLVVIFHRPVPYCLTHVIGGI